jgi:hypothetical protein
VVIGLLLFMAATTATITREVEAVTKAVDSGSLGSFFSVSASETTGASKLIFMPTTSNNYSTFNHFCPHPTPKSFVVNKKVSG